MAALILVGLPGSGKSSVGARVAASRRWRFADTDEVLARRAPVADLWRELGEEAFRALELVALTEALADADVVATGGGVVTTASGRRALAGQPCVWLTADPVTLAERVRVGDRPVLGDDHATRLAALARERGGWYAEVARTTVDASRTLAEVVADVARAVEGWASCG